MALIVCVCVGGGGGMFQGEKGLALKYIFILWP